MNSQLLKKGVPGFTRAELLVVLCIIGILVLITLPKLIPLIFRAKSTEVQFLFGHLYILQKRYLHLHSRYSDDPDELGFEHGKM